MLVFPELKQTDMPRKKAETNTTPKKRVVKKKSPVVEDVSLSEVSSRPSYLNKLNKKNIAIAAVVVGLGLLAFVASKYLVVAWVDNKPITRLDLMNELNKRYGKDTREQLIIQALIASEADKTGVNVSEADIDAEIKKIEGEQGGADKLNQALEMQGISQGEFRNLVKLQLLRQKLFSSGAGVTVEEVEKYIEENKAQLPETIDDKLKSSIKDELAQQKIAATYSAWLKDALAGSRIKRI